MKKLTLTAIAFVFAVSAFAQIWSLDPAHSKLGFGVTHLMISNVEGSFKSFNAKITSSKEDFSDAVIELTADVNSINTDNDQRDGHLKGADFFDAAQFPTLSFKSTSFKKKGKNTYTLAGNLTLHGVTKPVTLEVTFNGTAVHPYTKKTMAGFKVTGTLKRSDFGIGASTPGAVVSDEVTISANTEFAKD
ncbi:MAG TPA: YceI family protein [Ohtaekwangia sp.]|uniref:YceI family protein n=1 Tax=Ohtaekwangia sp. TaxID=2066019 RepID=UPI002F941CDE